MILGLSAWNMWETGSSEPRNIGVGSKALAVKNPTIRPCFVTEILGSVKLILGKKAILRATNVSLTNCDASSLVIDRLCDWTSGQNATVACFYFDFAAQKEQSAAAVLNSLLKQLVGGLENIPAKIVEAFRDQKRTAGGRRLELGQVVEMLQGISSSRPTFICIDALDECIPEYWAKLLDSLQQILHQSPSTRIFLAGRLHVRDEVEKHLAGRVTMVSITPSRDDIIRFLRVKLKQDTTPEAMDKTLEEDIIKNIPETISEL